MPMNQLRFQAWKEFHDANPGVWLLFRQFALQALESGRDHFSARMIGERIRWYTMIETTGSDFKINNNHLPYYARLLVGTEPQFEGFFQFRDTRFDATIDEIVEAG